MTDAACHLWVSTALQLCYLVGKEVLDLHLQVLRNVHSSYNVHENTTFIRLICPHSHLLQCLPGMIIILALHSLDAMIQRGTCQIPLIGLDSSPDDHR